MKKSKYIGPPTEEVPAAYIKENIKELFEALISPNNAQGVSPLLGCVAD
jgi:hypothetical protein